MITIRSPAARPAPIPPAAFVSRNRGAPSARRVRTARTTSPGVHLYEGWTPGDPAPEGCSALTLRVDAEPPVLGLTLDGDEDLPAGEILRLPEGAVVTGRVTSDEPLAQAPEVRVGAAVAARFAPRIKRPVLAYGVIELLIALWALAMPFGIRALTTVYIGWLGGLDAPPETMALTSVTPTKKISQARRMSPTSACRQ